MKIYFFTAMLRMSTLTNDLSSPVYYATSKAKVKKKKLDIL